jgi:hypothetical protein
LPETEALSGIFVVEALDLSNKVTCRAVVDSEQDVFYLGAYLAKYGYTVTAWEL